MRGDSLEIHRDRERGGRGGELPDVFNEEGMLEKSSFITLDPTDVPEAGHDRYSDSILASVEMRPLNTGATPRARAVINNWPFTSHYSSTLQRVDFRQTRGLLTSLRFRNSGRPAARVLDASPSYSSSSDNDDGSFGDRGPRIFSRW